MTKVGLITVGNTPRSDVVPDMARSWAPTSRSSRRERSTS